MALPTIGVAPLSLGGPTLPLRSAPLHPGSASTCCSAAARPSAFAVATLAIGMADVDGENPWPVASVIAYDAVFFVAAVGSIAFLIASVLTRRPGAPHTSIA